MPAALSLRAATMAERATLEALQRRAFDVWEPYRGQLAAHPDATVLPPGAVARATRDGATALEVTARPAQGFYEKVGFSVIGEAETRFGPAVRMRRDLP